MRSSAGKVATVALGLAVCLVAAVMWSEKHRESERRDAEQLAKDRKYCHALLDRAKDLGDTAILFYTRMLPDGKACGEIYGGPETER